MMTRGMAELTGEKRMPDAWRRFFSKDDVVGIKVNCVGRPHVVSSPEVVAEAVRNLTAIGIPPQNIVLYERFKDQMDEVDYASHLPAGVAQVGAEGQRGGSLEYDTDLYVEVNFFGEEDTRSNIMRVVSRRVTKIINIPNIKDHGASGATGCLKNLAYGSFSNVARSHSAPKSHTLSYIGTLAAVEPLRSKSVLQIVDGIRGVWHGGPFARIPRYRFYPKQMMFGTDPVAMDRLISDIVDAKRKAMGARSIWDRSPEQIPRPGGPRRDEDPNLSSHIREPGHVEFASKLGLGVYDPERIRLRRYDV
jgi:uncharacterized protein (DUF362 family)